MAPRRRLLLLAIAPLGACASAEQNREAALRLMLERSPLGHAAGPTSGQAEQPQIGAAPGMVADATGAGVATAVQLLGLEPEALRRWLGEPSLRRADGDAEVWLYAGPACALDLVLYPNAGRLRVAHANARASGTVGSPGTELEFAL